MLLRRAAHVAPVGGSPRRPRHVGSVGGELRPAAHLWGRDVWEATEAIRRELGDSDVQVATVGQAAENGVRYAGVFANLNRPAARTGMGTLMAAKNLKAVAVRGTGAFPVADMDRFMELIHQLDEVIYSHREYEPRTHTGTTRLILALNSLGCLPTRHFQQGTFEGAQAVSGETLAELSVWKNLTLESGWSNVGPPWNVASYLSDPSGLVNLRGMVQVADPPSGVAFILPPDAKPSANMGFSLRARPSGSADLTLTPTGEGWIEAESSVTSVELDGVRFSR